MARDPADRPTFDDILEVLAPLQSALAGVGAAAGCEPPAAASPFVT
jgi:hypothetical protein